MAPGLPSTDSKPSPTIHATRSAAIERTACPNGPVELSGLPAGYDYYGTCVMGACPGERAAAHIGLGVGESRELVRTTLELGASSCNTPVPTGEYRLSASVPGIEAACVSGSVLVVDAPETNPPTNPTPKPEATPTSANID